MKFSELKPGQVFTIIGRKTPHGFITLDDGLTHYGIDSDTFVSAQQSVEPTCFTCGHNLDSDGVCTNLRCAGPFTAGG
jgi:tRNA(Ile2) C34 agmatinyltransferase TiaS